MKRVLVCLLFLAVASLAVRSGQAAMIADSQADFSGVQGQDDWFYGLFNQGSDNTNAYSVGEFEEFDVFDGTSWTASDSLVGADNNDFLALNSAGGHPTGLGPPSQDSLIWAVRRYVSPVDESIAVSFDLRKINVFNNRGGGITGRIFVDGVEVYSQFIDNFDGVGEQSTIIVNASVGTIIDFAIDPTGTTPQAGTDGIFSARADGSHFSAVISTAVIPEPSSFALLAIGGLALLAYGRQHKRRGRDTPAGA